VIERPAPDGHIWLRLTRPDYSNPFEMSYAQRYGGRWNPPDSWPTLYLNENIKTVHAQVRHMFVGRGIDPDDLDDRAPIHLAAASLPRRQRAADVITDAGIASIGLPPSYPLDDSGSPVPRAITQPIAVMVKGAGLRGVLCRSAAAIGREFAWFPAPRASARPHWDRPKPFGTWRYAVTLDDVQ
jgi:hypothetical protein